jgi:hypothetical protein
VNGGLVEKTNISPIGGNTVAYYQTKESCDLKPFDPADTELKASYFYVLSLAAGIFNFQDQVDVSTNVIAPILALWKKGYFTGETFNSFRSPLKETSLLVKHLTGTRGDRLWINAQSKTAGCDTEISTETGAPFENYQNFSRKIFASTDDYSKAAAAKQFAMAAAPTEDMQIATKQYVDQQGLTPVVVPFNNKNWTIYLEKGTITIPDNMTNEVKAAL